MIVSFDLDDTLFVREDKIKTEPLPANLFAKFYKERLRKGTVTLLKQLKTMGITIYVYTTSFRSERYIRSLFRMYGIKFDDIINGKRHADEVQGTKSEPMPSKYPSHYRIDLHIDDDISVLQNGKIYGFKVHIVGENDDEWTDKIIEKVTKMQKLHS